MHEILQRLIGHSETVVYYLIIFFFIGLILRSLFDRFVIAIEPAAKRKENREKQETPIRLLFALSNCVAWLTALIIPTVLLRIKWFDMFFPILSKSALIIGVIAVVLYMVFRNDGVLQKAIVSSFGYWYIKYHQKIKKGSTMILHFNNNEQFKIKEIYLLHAIGTYDNDDIEFSMSNAELLSLAYGFGNYGEDPLEMITGKRDSAKPNASVEV